MGQPSGGSSIFQSTMGLGMAQTAILGDSQGSNTLSHLPKSSPSSSSPPTKGGVGTKEMINLQESTIPEEDLAADGGVGSMLGESYVDGRRAQMGVSSSSSSRREREGDEDEELEDGGVLGLLAQIYGTGVDLKGRGRGPPRAI